MPQAIDIALLSASLGLPLGPAGLEKDEFLIPLRIIKITSEPQDVLCCTQSALPCRPVRWIAAYCCTALRSLAVVGCGVLAAAASASAAEPIKFCSTGTITMGPFAEHIDALRKARRYDAADIDKLIADQRAGGAKFFSTQIVIKKEQSGSGDFDLNLFQGFSDPHAKYRRERPWACEAEDYPVAYFVGFKVRAVDKGSIAVARQKAAVNVISLKAIDPDLDKHTRVTESQNGAVLCEDIAAGCVKQIFYGRW